MRKNKNPIPKETLISAPFPDAQIDRDGRIRVIVLEPVVTNLEYNASPMNMTRHVEKRTWASSFLNHVEDKEIPRRVVAVRVAPPSTSKQGVKVKVVDRNTLRVHLDTTEGMYVMSSHSHSNVTNTSLTLEHRYDDDDDDDDQDDEEENESDFLSRVRDVLCVHAINGNHIKRYLNTENDVRTIFTRLGIKSLSSSDLSRLNRVLNKDSIFDLLCLDVSKEQEQQEQQDKRTHGRVFRFPSSVYSHNSSARDMWSKTGLPALHSLWNGTNGTWCSSAKFHLCLSLQHALRCQKY